MAQRQLITIFSSTGTPRFLPAGAVQDASWSTSARGGMESIQLPLAAGFSELDHFSVGDQVNVYTYDGAAPAVLRCRAYITERSRAKGGAGGGGGIGRAGGADQLLVSCLGLWSRIKDWPCDRLYSYPEGQDASRALADLVRDFVVPDWSDLVVELPSLGLTLTALDATDRTVGQVFDEIQRLVGVGCAYGCDVASTGANRLYFRPADSSVSLVQPVPSASVVAYEAQHLTDGCATRVRILGGNPRYPNLVPNGHMELSRIASEGQDPGNWLPDPGFEDRSGWTLGSGASYKAGGLSEGPTLSGDDMVETDNSGEYFERAISSDSRVVPGHIATFGGNARREVGGTTSTGWIRLYWRDSGGSETLGYSEVTVDPGSAWERFESSVAIPAGAAGWRFRGECTAGSLLWDDMLLSDSSLLRAVGWRAEANGSASLDAYLTRELPYEGTFALRCVASASDNDSNDARIRSDLFTVLARQNVRIRIRLRYLSGGTSPKLRLELRAKDAAGSESIHRETITAGSLTSSWSTHTYTVQFGTSGTNPACEIGINFRGSGTVEIDGVEVRDAASSTSEAFLAPGPYRATISCQQAFDVGTDPDLYNAEDSDHLGGIFWATEQVESATDYASALAFAKSYLRERARQLQRPPVTIADMASPVVPGQLVRLVGADGATLASGEQPVQRVRESWQDGILLTSLDIGRERPTLESILADLQRKSRRAGQLAAGAGLSSYSGTSGLAGQVTQVSGVISLPLAIASGGTGSTSASAARTALGLGTAAVVDVPSSGNATSGQAVLGSDTRLTDSRAPTTHTHTASAITDFSEAVDDRVASLLVAGSGITLSYNDGSNALTVSASGGSANYQMAITLLADNTTLSGITPSTGRQELAGNTFRRCWVDLADFNTCRISAVITATSGLTGALLCEYSTDSGSTWAALVTSDGAAVDISLTGTLRSGWSSLVSGAKADVLLRPLTRVDTSSSGTFTVGLIVIEFRTSSSTSSTSDDADPLPETPP